MSVKQSLAALDVTERNQFETLLMEFDQDWRSDSLPKVGGADLRNPHRGLNTNPSENRHERHEHPPVLPAHPRRRRGFHVRPDGSALAPDERLRREIFETAIFARLRQEHGKRFWSFIDDKVVAIQRGLLASEETWPS